MTIEVSTPALLFPAISLLFLSFTNRFLHLSALVRQLHAEWEAHENDLLEKQIANLRKRLVLIRWMQLLGAVSLLLCVTAMITILSEQSVFGAWVFYTALLLMAASLLCLAKEIMMSGGALEILLQQMERK